MIKFICASAQDRQLLSNLQQKYLYEMTHFYDNEIDHEGNYHFADLDVYFVNQQRIAILIFNDDKLVGFALLHDASYLSNQPDHVMAEFTIFPAYRRQHLAQHVVALIFSQYPGQWEIKYHEKNLAAKKLWEKVTQKYQPTKTHLNENETVLSFEIAA